MKVLLINPPDQNTIVADNPPFIDEERGYNPPLGLLYLAAYLRKHTPHEVEVLDAVVEQIGYDKLVVKHILKFSELKNENNVDTSLKYKGSPPLVCQIPPSILLSFKNLENTSIHSSAVNSSHAFGISGNNSFIFFMPDL